MKPVANGPWRSARWFLLIAGAGGIFAAEKSWIGTLDLDFVIPWHWSSGVAVNQTADFPVCAKAPIGTAPKAQMSMGGLINGLLFSRAPTGWRLESSNRELTSAWLTQQSAPIVTETSGNTLPAAFFSAGFATSSLSRIGPVPEDPHGAAEGFWISNASGNWGTPSNWQGGAVPSGSNVAAHFDFLDITTDVTVTVETNRTIGFVHLGDTNGTHHYNLAPGAGPTSLTFNGGLASSINQTSTSAGDTISVPIFVKNDLNVSNTSPTNPLTISGNIASSAEQATSQTLTFFSGKVNISGNISDGTTGATLGLRVDGEGAVVTLSGTNTYSGLTGVFGGTLLVNGSISNAGNVSVGNIGSVLGGTGQIGGNVVVFDGAKITGGTETTVGTLTLNDLTFSIEGSNAPTYLANLSGSTSDTLAVLGTLTLGVGDRLSISGAADGTTTYVLATFNTLVGTFDTVTGLPDNYTLVYTSSDIELVPIPEPATWIGGGLVLAALAFSQRRRLRRA